MISALRLTETCYHENEESRGLGEPYGDAWGGGLVDPPAGASHWTQ